MGAGVNDRVWFVPVPESTRLLLGIKLVFAETAVTMRLVAGVSTSEMEKEKFVAAAFSFSVQPAMDV